MDSPAKQDLCDSDPKVFCNLLDSGVYAKCGSRSSAQRGVCGEKYSLLFAVGLEICLWKTRVEFDLVCRWNDGAVREELLECLDGEVRYSDCLYFAYVEDG